MNNKIILFSSASILFILLILCLVVPLFSTHIATEPDYNSILQPPSLSHLFGTDGLGRDLMIRVFVGGQITFAIAFLATLTVVFIGTIYGAIAGFIGSYCDLFMMRIVDVLYAVPFLFFSILLLSLFGQSIAVSFVAIAAISWLDMARVVRAQALSLRHKEFVQAAILCGRGRLCIVFKHIIPNLIGVVVVYSALAIPNLIVLSTMLSFFGLGVVEPMTSWGVLISDGVQNISAWWLLFFPTCFTVLTLLAFAFIANGLRNRLLNGGRFDC